MKPLTRIIFTVTNDLTYDQRMQRICQSLSTNKFEVILVGRRLPDSLTLKPFAFQQKRLNCFFRKGFAFYAEYNLRLFFYLLFTKTDAFCAIDLDTIVPVWLASTIKRKKRVYDAHELFTEQKEIVTRPFIHKIWLEIEKFAVPKFSKGCTVNTFIKEELNRRYGIEYSIIRNLPVFQKAAAITESEISVEQKPIILYQGAVNEGRSFETLIPAMQYINAELVICGKGNFFEQVKELIRENNLEHKIKLLGYVLPDELKQITANATVGLTLFESTGLNQYYSLSNRFFDYIMGGIPQLCVGYPEYQAIVNEFEVALLIENTDTATIASALNKLLSDRVLYNRLKKNTIEARNVLNWGNEEKKLIAFWRNVFEKTDN